MEWFKVSENPPPENMDILGFTEEKRFKTFRSYKGKFDTYQTIVWWAIPDLPPEDEEVVEEPKKRGRKKKA
jgi:hypothetical protein